MARTLQALRSFREIAAGYQVTNLRTIATCAVREARNGPDFCRRVRDEVGIEIEVISSEREARLAFSSVQHAIDLTGRNVVVADIGGGGPYGPVNHAVTPSSAAPNPRNCNA
jgi:exopolyphosphatase/guanosine-5'-triphosphate,3'-diphosphate pyrophosphatase